MNALAHEWAAQWGAWAAERSLLLALLGGALWISERTLLRNAWPRLRLALHLAALAALFAPASVASRWSAATLIDRLAPTPDAGRALVAGAEAATAPSSSAPLVLFLVWAVVALLLVVATLVHSVRARARLDATDLGASPALVQRVAELARALRLRRIPAVIVVPGALGPLVVGGWRPRIVIPKRLAAGAAGAGGTVDVALDHALLHELLHVKRGDLWVAGLSRLATLLWWFHPMAWWIARRAAALRELGCDDDVAQRLRERAPAYRATLLDHASRLVGEQAPAGALGFFAAPSLILARLEWLARPRVHRPRLERATTLAAAATLLFVALPAAPALAAGRGLDRDRGAGATAIDPLAAEAAQRAAAFAIVRARLQAQRPPGCLQLQHAVSFLTSPDRTRSSP